MKRRTLVALMALGWLAVSCTFTAPAGAQEATTTSSPGATTTTTAQRAVISVSSSAAITFVLLVAGVLALIWFSIAVYDRISVNRWRRKDYMPLVEKMIEKAAPGSPASPPLSVADIRALAEAAAKPPRGGTGLTRTLLALGLLVLVGVALAALLVGDSGAADDTLKAVITALTTALTVVLGFYFGAQTANESADRATDKPAGTPAVRGGNTGNTGGGNDTGGGGGDDTGSGNTASGNAASGGTGNAGGTGNTGGAGDTGSGNAGGDTGSGSSGSTGARDDDTG